MDNFSYGAVPSDLASDWRELRIEKERATFRWAFY